MTTRHLGIGVVGLNARVERVVLPGIAGSGVGRVAAVCSRDLAKATAFAAAYPGCQAFDSLAEMLGRDEVEAVVIVTPPAQHAEMAAAAIAAGRHVCCEKPLATSYADAVELARAARARGVRTAVNFTYRSSPGLRLIARELRGAGIGTLRHIELAYLQSRGLWDRDPGRDPLGDLAPHLVDALLWWLAAAGSGRPARVAALTTGPPAAGESAWSPVWTVSVATDDGQTAVLQVNRAAPGRRNAIVAVLHGTAAALRLEFDTESTRVERVEASREPVDWRELPIPPDLAVGYADFPRRHFTRVIQALRGEATFPDFAQGARVQAILDAARAAARDGVTIDLPLADAPI